MVVWIGKDCWDIINQYKYNLEHKEKFKKSLNIIKNLLRRPNMNGDIKWAYIKNDYEVVYQINIYQYLLAEMGIKPFEIVGKNYRKQLRELN